MGSELLLLSAAVEGVAAIGGAAARISALKEREAQEQVAADQQSLQRTQQLRRVVGAQEASAGVRGVSVASPSFQAIEANTFDQWAQDERALDLSRKFSEASTKSAITQTEFGAGLQLAGTGLNLFNIGQAGGFGLSEQQQALQQEQESGLANYRLRNVPQGEGL